MENRLSYQIVKQDFYEIMRRRSLKLEDLALAIYLRGKANKFGNPFFQSDSFTCRELNISKKVLKKVRSRLQETGVINFDSFQGRGKATSYNMLDTVMIPKIKGSRSGNKGSHSGSFFSCSKGSHSGPPNISKYYREIESSNLVDRKTMKKDVEILLQKLQKESK